MSRQVRHIRRPNYARPSGPTNTGPKQTAGKIKRQRRWEPRQIVGGLVLALLMAGLLFMGHIAEVQVSGANNEAAVQRLVDETLDQGYLPANLWWLSTDELEQRLLSEHPSVLASISISKDWLGRGIKVQVEERRAVIRWQTDQGEYGVDQIGVITGRLDRGESPKLPLVVDSTNLEVTAGRTVAPARFVDFTLKMQQLLNSSEVKFVRGRLVETTNELLIDTNKGYYLRVDTTRPAQEQFDNLKLLLARKITPSQYIDLRIAHKAYYR